MLAYCTSNVGVKFYFSEKGYIRNLTLISQKVTFLTKIYQAHKRDATLSSGIPGSAPFWKPR